MGFVNLQDILHGRLMARGLREPVQAATVLAEMNTALTIVLGKDILRLANAVAFKNGKLTVRIANPTVADALYAREQELVATVHQALEEQLITSVRYQL